jgi:hypothetical protein
MSDLQGSRSRGNSHSATLSRAIFDRQARSDEFRTQLTAANSEIDSTKLELEQLMARAHPFCSNSGIGSSGVHLAIAPPRFAGTPVASSKMLGTRAQQGAHFSGAAPRKMGK